VSAATSDVSDVDLSRVEAAVGSRSFGRGRVYARRDRVVSIEWDPDGETLTGSVVGQGALYSTAARGVAGGPPRQLAAEVQPPSWETPLRALIGGPAPQAAGNPLAIELTLRAGGVAGRGAPRLMARLMRPGARGGWINGALAWSGLDSWHVQSGEYRPDHLALVRELYAVHRAREGRAGYYSNYGADKALDLSGWDSPQPARVSDRPEGNPAAPPSTPQGWPIRSDAVTTREKLHRLVVEQWAEADDAAAVEDDWALANAREAIREEPW